MVGQQKTFNNRSNTFTIQYIAPLSLLKLTHIENHKSLFLEVYLLIVMPNLNVELDDKTFWRFHEVKTKLKAKTNVDCLKKLLELVK